MNAQFQLHPELRQDCLEIGNFALSRILLMNDSQYPWCILVPRRSEILEIYRLDTEDQQLLIQESSCLAQAMQQIYQPDKLNIAAIGNLVPQLHLHHVARYRSDIAWPTPVWGKFPAVPYAGPDAKFNIARLRQQLADVLID